MGLRVLLVDEQEEARSSLAQRLRRSGCVELLAAARDMDEAAAILKETRPDVVLVDLHRRDGREIEVCRTLCQETGAPVVALASFMTPERWEEVQTAGVSGYVLKHVDTDGLGRELARLVECHGAARPAE